MATEAGDLDNRFKEFIERVKKMAQKSSREADLHLGEEEESLEFPFHDGETGSFELAVDYLTDVADKGSQVSLNVIEEAYMKLLLSYKRMKSNVSALGEILRAMQLDFGLPTEEEMEERH